MLQRGHFSGLRLFCSTLLGAGIILSPNFLSKKGVIFFYIIWYGKVNKYVIKIYVDFLLHWRNIYPLSMYIFIDFGFAVPNILII